MRRHVARGARAERIPTPGLLNARVSSGRIEAAAREHHISVNPRLIVALRVKLDDPSHLPPVFGGNPSGVDGERIDIVSFDLGAKAGRPVIGERNAVNYKLSLIFG